MSEKERERGSEVIPHWGQCLEAGPLKSGELKYALNQSHVHDWHDEIRDFEMVDHSSR